MVEWDTASSAEMLKTVGFLPLPSLKGGCRGSMRYISISKFQADYLGPTAPTILAAAWRVTTCCKLKGKPKRRTQRMLLLPSPRWCGVQHYRSSQAGPCGCDRAKPAPPRVGDAASLRGSGGSLRRRRPATQRAPYRRTAAAPSLLGRCQSPTDRLRKHKSI